MLDTTEVDLYIDRRHSDVKGALLFLISSTDLANTNSTVEPRHKCDGSGFIPRGRMVAFIRMLIVGRTLSTRHAKCSRKGEPCVSKLRKALHKIAFLRIGKIRQPGLSSRRYKC
jgi:hypothetical protein